MLGHIDTEAHFFKIDFSNSSYSKPHANPHATLNQVPKGSKLLKNRVLESHEDILVHNKCQD
jgi:hypothetical protein